MRIDDLAPARCACCGARWSGPPSSTRPSAEQPAILAFCARALEALPPGTEPAA